MAKNYKVGENYYLPVIVSKIYPPCPYPIKITFNDGRNTSSNAISDKPGLLLTAEDIATVINTERDDALEELKSRNAELKADCNEWKNTADERLVAVQTLGTERNKLMADLTTLKAERDSARKQADIFQEEIKKLTAERDSAQGDLVTAREAIDYLQEENNKLKREVENRTTDYKLMRDNNAVYLSRIAVQNEVINALVEKIRRLEGGET